MDICKNSTRICIFSKRWYPSENTTLYVPTEAIKSFTPKFSLYKGELQDQSCAIQPDPLYTTDISLTSVDSKFSATRVLLNDVKGLPDLIRQGTKFYIRIGDIEGLKCVYGPDFFGVYQPYFYFGNRKLRIAGGEKLDLIGLVLIGIGVVAMFGIIICVFCRLQKRKRKASNFSFGSTDSSKFNSHSIADVVPVAVPEVK